MHPLFPHGGAPATLRRTFFAASHHFWARPHRDEAHDTGFLPRPAPAALARFLHYFL
ncbi:MAG: hypothetical protein H7335_10765 [Massilia sp.]|nr:hypothetical protein [Massilia sp.]